MTDSHFEVFPISVYSSHHDLVPENKFEINAIRGDLDHLVSASHACEHQDSVLAKGLHAVEYDRRIASAFEDQIEGTVLFGRLGDRYVFRRHISRSKFLDQIGVQVRLCGASNRGHVQTLQTQNERGEQADGSGSHDRGFARTPHLQPALNLIGLVNSFLHNGGGLQQHSDVFEALRYLDDEFDVIDVVFRQITVAQIDAALVVRVVRGHVVGADQVINALAWPANSRHDVVAGPHFGDIWADGLNLTETLVADDQEVVSGRRCSVFSGVDLFVGAVHPNP